MPGELASLNTALINGAYTHRVYSASYVDLTGRINEFDLAGLKIQFADAVGKYRDAATLLTQLRNAVGYLVTNGEWWNNVDIATLKQDILNQIGRNQSDTVNSLASVATGLADLINGVSSDVRWALWPDFSSLESTIRNYSGASLPAITQALDSIKTTINVHSTLKAGETALAIANAQSAVLGEVTARANALETAFARATESIGAAISKSEQTVAAALAKSQDIITLSIAGVAQKTEDLFGSLLDEVRKYFAGAGDDIAEKVARYLFSYAYEETQ